ncbi:MAG: hypothetical protein HY445_00375 [Candidatus Niyogibacteria bacterium]|nr:hypothetical protein [Candidatus Niyogibacteria bacterium]
MIRSFVIRAIDGILKIFMKPTIEQAVRESALAVLHEKTKNPNLSSYQQDTLNKLIDHMEKNPKSWKPIGF